MQEQLTIAQDWLREMGGSVTARDLERHMELVSKKVMVYGVPGNEAVDYRGWLERRRHELGNGLLLGLSYDAPRIKTITLRRIAFNINESMLGSGHRAFLINKDVILENEDDGAWRVVEETIKSIKRQVTA